MSPTVKGRIGINNTSHRKARRLEKVAMGETDDRDNYQNIQSHIDLVSHYYSTHVDILLSLEDLYHEVVAMINAGVLL